MRTDGRAHDALRAVKMTPGYVMHPEGSVLIEMGQTRVLCNASVDNRVPPWLAGAGRGWVTAEYALLPRSTHTRTPRETSGLRGRTQEIRRLIGRALRAAVDLQALGERQIIVDCDVLQADGGTRTAAITGGYVALVLALERLIQGGVIPPTVHRTAVAAVSAGVVRGEPLLDLCYEEDHVAQVDLNVVMTAEGEFVEVQGTAEGMPFDRRTMDVLLDLAGRGIQELLQKQKTTLEERG
jgi:ribonuclease PH